MITLSDAYFRSITLANQAITQVNKGLFNNMSHCYKCCLDGKLEKYATTTKKVCSLECRESALLNICYRDLNDDTSVDIRGHSSKICVALFWRDICLQFHVKLRALKGSAQGPQFKKGSKSNVSVNILKKRTNSMKFCIDCLNVKYKILLRGTHLKS